MLGQPSSMLIPRVVGYRLTGRLPEGATATDLVLTITEALRKKGVVGKFVEFFGPGLRAPDDRRSRHARQHVPRVRRDGRDLPDRRHDARLPAVHRPRRRAGRARRGLREGAGAVPHRRDAGRGVHATRSSSIWRRSSRASPVRGVRRIACPLAGAKTSFAAALPDLQKGVEEAVAAGGGGAARRRVGATQLEHGSVVIAAITSCTNTSNPSVMIAAGLVAKKARRARPHQQAVGEDEPRAGSKVVTEYLAKAGLQTYLDALGFNLVGYGCTTCIGNSGPLPDEIAAEVRERGLVVASVLSRQPQLRGPHPAGRARELPRVAAARRRLRAGGLAQRRSDDRAARARARTASPST